MEGAVMLARTYRSFDAYDTAVASLRDYIERLLVAGTSDDPKRAARLPRSGPTTCFQEGESA